MIPTKPLRKERQQKYELLRKEYPFLTFRKIHYQITSGLLYVTFEFDLSGKILFQPSFSIKSSLIDQISDNNYLQWLIFHIGIAELISYWKTTCPPVVRIEPYTLPSDAHKWWKNLYRFGLGEFFHTNGIEPDENFISFLFEGKASPPAHSAFNVSDMALVPIGGGKDSSVTLEILQHSEKNIKPFLLNPIKASIDTCLVAGFSVDELFIINRKLDPKMVEMNEQGFLNGHTPFSALLAFYSLLAAHITNRFDIVLSNESSASEPTVPDTMINHQYSKSLAFETDFRNYTSRFIHPAYNYFSFLRPLNELQIASLFATMPRYHPVFRSCNAGSKTGIWCGNCPKCLFTFIILSPFLASQTVENIFNKSMLDAPDLTLFLEQLTGLASEKPFDCVGTIAEVTAAVQKLICSSNNGQLPALLRYYVTKVPVSDFEPALFQKLLTENNFNHHLDHTYLKILTDALDKRPSK